MVRTADKDQLIAEVVQALVQPNEDGAEAAISFAASLRAAAGIKPRKARAYVEALLVHLADEPESIAELESLILLGLSHADSLDRQRVPLSQEGRRLAIRLEKAGNVDRALQFLEALGVEAPDDAEVERAWSEMMRRAGRTEQLIERYLARAEEAVREDCSQEAIAWLNQVLALDRSRRDVARMIRDLQYEEAYHSRRWQRRGHVLKGVVSIAVRVAILALIVGAVAWRETWVADRYRALPAAAANDLESTRARLAAVDGFIQQQRLWLGLFEASRERSRLRGQVDRLEGELAAERRRADEAQLLQQALADSAVERGRLAISAQDYEVALEEFEAALELGGPGWELAEELNRDTEAIREFLEDER